MQGRRIAIFIDGGFFLKRLHAIAEERYRDTPAAVANTAYRLCKFHVLRLVGRDKKANGRWLDYAYRFFYYDAYPLEKGYHHPLTGKFIKFYETDEAEFRKALFEELKKKRKFALRLGYTTINNQPWKISEDLTKKVVKTKRWMEWVESVKKGKSQIDSLSEDEEVELREIQDFWKDFDESCIKINALQKGVDMRLGIDVTSVTLKQQANTLILVTGDSDFLPVAKLARREGAEVILDPLHQPLSNKNELIEHIDGLYSVFKKVKSKRPDLEESGPAENSEKPSESDASTA